MSRLDRHAFRRWLREQPPDAAVGVTWSVTGCPLARYLGRGWQVDGRTAKAPGQWRRLPDWAAAFAYAVDDLTSFPGHEWSVSAAVALDLLDELEGDIGADEALSHAH
jgi:hypothetical protein